ncbi:MAG: PDZ domain-containing protein [Myxococcota bacterium]|jgi:hypothetical protein|nr:PDZ domain-containing protein [Myxococcota bacterium]
MNRFLERQLPMGALVPMNSWGWVLALAAMTIGPSSGCGSSAMPELASIDEVGPDILEEGDVLFLQGEGFVEGPVELVLDGTFTPTGLARPRTKRVGLEASATSPSHIELQTTASVMARLTDEPVVFRGHFTASFPAAPGAQLAMEARSGAVTLELRPSGSAVLVAAERAREAERYLEALGVSLSPAGAAGELVVATVMQGSAAARAGMAPLDRLLGVDGRSLADLSELGGIEASKPHVFEVVSAAGEMRNVPLRMHAPLSLENDEMFALALAASLLGAFFVFAAPRRRDHSIGQSGPAHLAVAALVSLPVALLPLIANLETHRPALLVCLLGTAAVALCGYELSAEATLKPRAARVGLRLLVLASSALVAILWGGGSGAWLSSFSRGGSFVPASALLSPAHLAVLLCTLSLLYPSPRGSGPLSKAWRDLASLPSMAAMVVLWLPPASFRSSQHSSWSEAAMLWLLTAVLLIAARELAPRRGDRRRRSGRNGALGWRLAALAGGSAATVAVSQASLSIELRTMATVLTTALFFAIAAAAVLSAWRGGGSQRCATRARMSESMNGGTSPLISPP